MAVGILALQGAFAEHGQMLDRLGVEHFEIRQLRDLEKKPDRLILPGRWHWDFLPFRPIFAVWVEICGRGLRESLPFRPIFAVWVEMSGRWHWDFLPFRPIFAVCEWE